MVRFRGRRRISCSVHEGPHRVRPTSYSVGTRDTFAGVKRPERAANHAGTLIPRLRMNGPITPFFVCIHDLRMTTLTFPRVFQTFNYLSSSGRWLPPGVLRRGFW